MNIYLDKELTSGKKKGTGLLDKLQMESIRDKGTISGLQKKTIKSMWELIKMEKEAHIQVIKLQLNGGENKIKVMKD